MHEQSASEIFRAQSFNPTTKAIRSFDRSGLAREIADPEVFSWIDLQAPDETALRGLLVDMGLDDVPCRGFQAPEILPRVEEHARYISFHLYEIQDPDRHLDTSHGIAELRTARLVFMLGKDFVITFPTTAPSPRAGRRRLLRERKWTDGSAADYRPQRPADHYWTWKPCVCLFSDL